MSAAARKFACKLDSKARLVLPLFVRERLSVSKNDVILLCAIEDEETPNGGLVLVVKKLSSSESPSLLRTSKNGWEK
ncbi:MAG: hypothetical protein V1717_01730 [Candidatus Micrarchaeota archaeon]